MRVRKSVVWALALVVVAGGGFAAYKSVNTTSSSAHQVDLATFNNKEDQLTKEATEIHQEIQTAYGQLEKGSLSAQDFKKQMGPLYDQMKKNWADYDQYTKSNALTDKERNSKAFKEGVKLASNIRLDEYTFLINVTQYKLNKAQIEQKYKDSLANFDAKLKQYEAATKDLPKA